MKGVIRVGHGMWNGTEHKKKVTAIVTEKKKKICLENEPHIITQLSTLSGLVASKVKQGIVCLKVLVVLDVLGFFVGQGECKGSVMST